MISTSILPVQLGIIFQRKWRKSLQKFSSVTHSSTCPFAPPMFTLISPAFEVESRSSMMFDSTARGWIVGLGESTLLLVSFHNFISGNELSYFFVRMRTTDSCIVQNWTDFNVVNHVFSQIWIFGEKYEWNRTTSLKSHCRRKKNKPSFFTWRTSVDL